MTDCSRCDGENVAEIVWLNFVEFYISSTKKSWRQTIFEDLLRVVIENQMNVNWNELIANSGSGWRKPTGRGLREAASTEM